MDQTYEGVVVQGQIRLAGPIEPPDHTRVIVIVPGDVVPTIHRAPTPRLAHPEQASDFRMEVIDEQADDSV
jgi:hypothetical protein